MKIKVNAVMCLNLIEKLDILDLRFTQDDIT